MSNKQNDIHKENLKENLEEVINELVNDVGLDETQELVTSLFTEYLQIKEDKLRADFDDVQEQDEQELATGDDHHPNSEYEAEKAEFIADSIREDGGI